MDVLIINGSPAIGKTTIANCIHADLGGAHIDMGKFREMYLDRAWAGANQTEAQMAFDLACHTAKVFLSNGIRPIVLVDLSPVHVAQVAYQFAGIDYGIATLTVTDRALLERRMTDPTRDSGFNDIDRAWAWNRAELSRDLLPQETRIDTSDLDIQATRRAVINLMGNVKLGEKKGMGETR